MAAGKTFAVRRIGRGAVDDANLEFLSDNGNLCESRSAAIVSERARPAASKPAAATLLGAAAARPARGRGRRREPLSARVRNADAGRRSPIDWNSYGGERLEIRRLTRGSLIETCDCKFLYDVLLFHYNCFRSKGSSVRKNVLVIGCGTEIYRGYIIKSVSERYNVFIISATDATWAEPYAAQILYVDENSPTSLFECVKELRGRHPIDGVMTCEERYVELTTAVALDLELPCNSLESAFLCRDKYGMRSAFARNGVATASCVLVHDADGARKAAEEIGFPFVVKPRDMSGSIGVRRVDDLRSLEEHLESLSKVLSSGATRRKGFLVEEFLEGPEVSVECVVLDGRPEVVAITRKTVGFDPFFEELGHVVAPREPLAETRAIVEVVRAAHEALEIRRGVTHAELRLTPQGPRMIEIAQRLGGDRIPELVHLATGVDLAMAAADVAVGGVPDLAPRSGRAAAVRFVYPPYDCRMRGLPPNEALMAIPGIRELGWIAEAGSVHRLPPGGYLARLALVVAEGATGEDCLRTLDAAERMLELDLLPA